MSDKQAISDQGSMNKYFAMMLHMDDDDLDPYEYRLLGHYRKFCGLHGGTCKETVQETAQACKMGVATARKARNSLKKKGRIQVKQPKTGPVAITLLDYMEENIRRYAKPIKNDRPNGGEPITSDRGSLSHLIGSTPEIPAPQTDKSTPLRISKESKNKNQIPPETEVSAGTPPPKLSRDARTMLIELETGGIAIAKTEAARQAELDLVELGRAAAIGCIRGIKPVEQQAIEALNETLKPLAEPTKPTLTGASFLQAWVDTIGKDRFPRTMDYKTLGGAAKRLIKAHPDLTVDEVKQDAALFKAYLEGLNGSCPVLEWNAPQFLSFFKLADNMAHQAITPVMVKWYVEEEKKSAFWVGKTISFQHVANNVLSAVKERNPHLAPSSAAPKAVCPKCHGQGFTTTLDETGRRVGIICTCQEAPHDPH